MAKKIIDGIIAVLGLALCIGVKLVFHACEVDGDMVMACHWAEQVSMALGVVIAIQGLAALICEKRAGMGIRIAVIPTALMAVLTPGVIINLCMMTDMRCHMIMRPAVMVIGILVIVIAVVGLIMDVKGRK